MNNYQNTLMMESVPVKPMWSSFCIVLAIFISIISCSNPTEISGNRILDQLVCFPELTPPLVTEENMDNDGLINTLMYFNDILDKRSIYYISWINKFYNSAFMDDYNGYYRWVQFNEYDSDYILYVTPGDTLHIRIDVVYANGSVRQHVYGYVVPRINRGLVYGPTMTFAWRIEDNVRIFAMTGYAIKDTIDGGGSLAWNPGFPDVSFNASWDGNGHGVWSDENGNNGWW